MIHELRGLRSSNLAHILSAIGIAYCIKDLGRVGWSNEDSFVVIDTEEPSSSLDVAIENGLRDMRKTFRSFCGIETQELTLLPLSKKQGQKGRKLKNAAKDEDEETDPSVLALTEMLPELSQNAGDALASVFCLASSDNGRAKKTRAMLGKSRHWNAVSNDEMRLGRMIRLRGPIAEFSNAQFMSDSAMLCPSDKTGTDYDTSMSIVNKGISQATVTRYPHPMVEMLSIAGLQALPALPSVSGNPRHRGMHSEKGNLHWILPIWREPLGYYEIESFLADGRPFEKRWRDILEVRTFDFKKNGNSYTVQAGEVQRASG